jgi:hypothetical protein
LRLRSILIKPYFEEWGSFLGEPGRQLVDNIATNISNWETYGEAAMGEERAAKIKEKPNVPLPALPGSPSRDRVVRAPAGDTKATMAVIK